MGAARWKKESAEANDHRANAYDIDGHLADAEANQIATDAGLDYPAVEVDSRADNAFKGRGNRSTRR